MSFADCQRQIEIVADPQLVEQWKEDARKVTSYSTSTEEPPMEFASALETERHFRDKYLPGLIRSVVELSVDGRTSRRLNDRTLYRLIENEWTKETRSPSRMMQALATQFRQSGLQVFRHRRGMLFVSRIRPKPLVPDETAISVSVKSIIEALAAHAGITRKELADKILANTAGDELERAKLSLAAELHWLIGEGHVIEFNDGSLDLPRVKAKRPEQGSAESVAPTVEASPPEDSRPSARDSNSDGAPGDKQLDSTGSRSTGEVVAAIGPTGESEQTLATSGSTTAEVEIGGS